MDEEINDYLLEDNNKDDICRITSAFITFSKEDGYTEAIRFS